MVLSCGIYSFSANFTSFSSIYISSPLIVKQISYLVPLLTVQFLSVTLLTLLLLSLSLVIGEITPLSVVQGAHQHIQHVKGPNSITEQTQIHPPVV